MHDQAGVRDIEVYKEVGDLSVSERASIIAVPVAYPQRCPK